jgi:hypothetical protein
LRTDLENHARVLAESLAKSSEPLLQKHSNRELQRLIDRFNDREQIAGVAVYDAAGQLVAMTSGFPWRAGNDPALRSVPADGEIHMEFLKLGGSRMHMVTLPLRNENAVIGSLVLLHDAGYIDKQAWPWWRHTFWRVNSNLIDRIRHLADASLGWKPASAADGGMAQQVPHGSDGPRRRRCPARGEFEPLTEK